MANEAYKVIADTSLSRSLRTVTNLDGVEIEESTGQAYRAGEYVLASELTARLRERAANGELDHLLEPVSLTEAEEARQIVETGLFIPEHEAERFALLDAGHRVVERDQVIDLRSAGAEAAKANLEASRETPADANPGVTENPSFVEVPSITEAQNEGQAVLPKDAETVDVSEVEAVGVEMPPGLPVGPTLAKAEGADPEEVDKETEKSSKKARRAKPGTESSSTSASASKEGSGS